MFLIICYLYIVLKDNRNVDMLYLQFCDVDVSMFIQHIDYKLLFMNDFFPIYDDYIFEERIVYSVSIIFADVTCIQIFLSVSFPWLYGNDFSCDVVRAACMETVFWGIYERLEFLIAFFTSCLFYIEFDAIARLL